MKWQMGGADPVPLAFGTRAQALPWLRTLLLWAEPNRTSCVSVGAASAVLILACITGVACAAKHVPPVSGNWSPPASLTHCTVVDDRGRVVFLACPANTSYTAGPLTGTTLVEVDKRTKQILRVTP